MFAKFSSLPHIHIGKGIFVQVGEVIKRKQGKNLLIITDEIRGLREFYELFALLRIVGKRIRIVETKQMEIGSILDKRTLSFLCRENFDTVIGIGCVRTLKQATNLAFLLKEKCKQFANSTPSNYSAVSEKNIILIPTVISTGEEFHQHSSITKDTYNPIIRERKTLPTTLIYDPLMTKVTPPPLLAASSVDSLSHALDTYLFSKHSSYIRKITLLSLQLSFANLLPAIYNPKNIVAREKLVIAGVLSSQAKFYMKHSFIHSLTEPLEKVFRLSHSVASAVILPYLIDHYNTVCADKSNSLLQHLNKDKMSRHLLQLAPYVKQTLSALGFPMTLSEFGIKQEHVQTLVLQWKKSIENDANIKKITDLKHVTQIYTQAVNGTLFHSQ